MRQTESLLLLGVFAVGLFVVYWLKKHRQARHNQALAAQLKRYPSVRQAWLAAGAKREAVLLVPGSHCRSGNDGNGESRNEAAQACRSMSGYDPTRVGRFGGLFVHLSVLFAAGTSLTALYNRKNERAASENGGSAKTPPCRWASL